MDQIKQWIEAWLSNLAVLGYSPATQQTYRYQIRCLLRFLCDSRISDVNNLDRIMLRQWQQTLARSKRWSLRSQCVKVRATKSFLRFLFDQRRIPRDLSLALREPRGGGQLPPMPPSTGDVLRLLEAVDASRHLERRDSALFELLYSSGIRVSECAALTVFDVNLEDQVLRVRQGKGATERILPFGAKACRALNLYLNLTRPIFAAKQAATTAALFLNVRGGQLTPCGVRHRFAKYRLELGLSGRLTPHGLRRAMATGMISSLGKPGPAADMGSVQAMLGHRRLIETVKYAQITAEDLKLTHQKTHPRELRGSL